MTANDQAPTNEPAAKFDEEVARLRVKGGDPAPERAMSITGVVLFLIGIVLCIVALQQASLTSDPLESNEKIILALLGVVLGLGGIVVWARASMTKYLRYWLLRGIFEQRYQQDRNIEALERISDRLAPGAD